MRLPGFPLRVLLVLSALLVGVVPGARAQAPADTILRIGLTVGRSHPLTTRDPVTRVAVADPQVADVVVITERDLVINGKANGETDIVLWSGDRPRVHYRVVVRAAADRRMVLLSVRLAEVRRDVLRQMGTSALFRDRAGDTRVGSGIYRNGGSLDAEGNPVLPSETRFLTILSDFGTREFLAFLEGEAQHGRARLLAEPNLLTADRDSASFLAGGEIPIPVVQGVAGVSTATQGAVTIQYREFGVRLRFSPDIVSDSIVKLYVRPEVSSLDYANAILLNGFRIPALRTRRVESTVDIRRDQSVIISGLFNDERERVRTGIPLLMDIPVLGLLFSSNRWQRNETELLVVVTPRIVDPASPGDDLALPLRPADRLPAREALRPRLPADTTTPPRPRCCRRCDARACSTRCCWWGARPTRWRRRGPCWSGTALRHRSGWGRWARRPRACARGRWTCWCSRWGGWERPTWRWWSASCGRARRACWGRPRGRRRS